VVNHYQRLKIAQDAPPEVIRAAYRALATKLHPDRQGPDTGPADALHSEMAALNAAYETLIDPKLRADYDATLITRPQAESAWSAVADPVSASAPGAPASVDIDWLRGGNKQPAGKDAGVRKEVLISWIGGVALVAVSVGWAAWHFKAQRQTDEALSKEFRDPVAQQVAEATPPPPVKHTPGAGRQPTVEELARMSDEELMKALPKLDEQGKPDGKDSRFSGPARHMLDGSPLRLRNATQLVDPLAPEPAKR